MNKKSNTVLIVLLILWSISFISLIIFNPYMAIDRGRPEVIAHRGGALLYPENTMVAFDGAAEMGVDILEMDIFITMDGVLVTHHDETIDRTSNGSGYISEYTYDELLQFNFAYHFQDINNVYTYKDNPVNIPKLEEVFQRHGSTPMIVEIKNSGDLGYQSAEALKELIEAYQLQDSILVASFHRDVLKYFSKITEGTVGTSATVGEATSFIILNKLFLDGFYFKNDLILQVPPKYAFIRLDRKRFIRGAHRRNMKVQYWTINDEDEMMRLIKKGADGIMTDRPDLLINILDEMGY